MEVLTLTEVQINNCSLPSGRHSALGSLSALCFQTAGCSVLICKSLPSSSCRSLLLHWLAVDSLGEDWSCYSFLGKQKHSLFLIHTWTYFLCGHRSWRLELCHPSGDLPACPSPGLTPGSCTEQRWFTHPYQVLPGSGYTCHSDMWSLTLPSVPSQQGSLL